MSSCQACPQRVCLRVLEQGRPEQELHIPDIMCSEIRTNMGMGYLMGSGSDFPIPKWVSQGGPHSPSLNSSFVKWK
jgi:hypothetical protein